MIILELFISKNKYMGWRDGSVIKSTGYSSRRPRFNSQCPHGSLQPSATPVLEELMQRHVGKEHLFWEVIQQAWFLETLKAIQAQFFKKKKSQLLFRNSLCIKKIEAHESLSEFSLRKCGFSLCCTCQEPSPWQSITLLTTWEIIFNCINLCHCCGWQKTILWANCFHTTQTQNPDRTGNFPLPLLLPLSILPSSLLLPPSLPDPQVN